MLDSNSSLNTPLADRIRFIKGKIKHLEESIFYTLYWKDIKTKTYTELELEFDENYIQWKKEYRQLRTELQTLIQTKETDN